MESTNPDILLLGYLIAKPTLFQLAGTFGGYMPLIVDLIQRESQKPEERAALDKTFWSLKALILPLCAFILTAFAVSSSNVTTWLAALYLGASFPMLAQRAVLTKPSHVNTQPGA